MSDVKLTVSAGGRDRWQCPVTVELEGPGVASLHEGEQAVPCQSRPLGNGRCELRFIVERLDAGSSREYVATLGTPAASESALRLEERAEGVALLQNGEELSTYYLSEASAARPYWYPLPDPYGNSLTRGYPRFPQAGEREDHPHHRSLWVAYGEVNGTDNWSQLEGHGTQTHESWNALEAGPVYALLDEQVCWRSNTGAPVLDEHRVWRVYNLPASCRLWEAEIDLTAAPGVGDVTFGDTKEGGILSVRVTSSMDAPKGRIENAAGGVNEGETWGKRAHWCDYSGPVKGNWVGVAVFDHPTSFRYPTWWHVRNYGLMTANCFGLSHFTEGREDGTYVLPAGETMRFRYRVYLHPGDATAGQVETRYHDYIHPPQIKVG
ncbi:MAG: PmoA family protein [Armatimonadetes bacterium]|nr:PmoA family protein [Armatimonadota bacterium]